MYYSTISARLNERNKTLEEYYGMSREREVVMNCVKVNEFFILSGVGFDLQKNFGMNSVENYDKVSFVYKEKIELKLKGVIVVKEIYDFIKEMSHKMRVVDNYFHFHNEKTVIELSSFIVLEYKDTTNNISKEKIDISSFYIGDKIRSINSNLSYINRNLFTHSISEGCISAKLTEHIYFLDIRGTPNSISSIIVDYTNRPLLITFLAVNQRHFYSPFIFAFSLSALLSCLPIQICIVQQIKAKNVYDSIFLITDNEN